MCFSISLDTVRKTPNPLNDDFVWLIVSKDCTKVSDSLKLSSITVLR